MALGLPVGTGVRRAVAVLALRLVLVGIVTVIAWLFVSRAGATAFPPSPLFASLALLPVNIVCLLLLRRMLRTEGRSLRDLLGWDKARLGRDIGWGLLWIAVLYLPFAGTIAGVMWLLHGDGMFAAFETVFFDPASVPVMSPLLALIMGIIVLLTFAPLNAPAEELLYRGYAQARLVPAWGAAAAIIVPALVFGAQHAFFAPTADAVIVYVAAFTVWGLGSGLIYARQRRLMPLVVAHFVVNLLSSAPALVFPILQLAGRL